MPRTGLHEDLATLRPVVSGGEMSERGPVSCKPLSWKCFIENMGYTYWTDRGWVCLSTQYLQSVGLTSNTEGDPST